MSEKKDYDPYMDDYEREVFEALGMKFKLTPREIKLIDEILADLKDCKYHATSTVFFRLTELIVKYEAKKNDT